MPFISLTRLRLRSILFLPLFAVDAIRSTRQLRAAGGFLGGELLPDRKLTFWTMTAWNTEEHMRVYIRGGAHGKAMRKLMHWCDEASIAHWLQEAPALPSWEDAERRMRTEGRCSKVLHPSPQHATLSFAPARTSRRAKIAPAAPRA